MVPKLPEIGRGRRICEGFQEASIKEFETSLCCEAEQIEQTGKTIIELEPKQIESRKKR